MALPVAILIGLAAVPAASGEGIWAGGLRTWGGVDFKPGNDLFIGPEIYYSNFHLGGHRFQIKAAWLTSRLEAEFQEVLRYDLFLLTPVWHFRRKAIFDPTLQVDLGYARYDREGFEELDNTTWLTAIEPGLNLNFAQGRYGLHYHFGYNLITPQMHTLTPLIFGLELWMSL